MWDRGWYVDNSERRGLRCGTEDGMLTFLKDGDLDVGQRMVC